MSRRGPHLRPSEGEDEDVFTHVNASRVSTILHLDSVLSSHCY